MRSYPVLTQELAKPLWEAVIEARDEAHYFEFYGNAAEMVE